MGCHICLQQCFLGSSPTQLLSWPRDFHHWRFPHPSCREREPPVRCAWPQMSLFQAWAGWSADLCFRGDGVNLKENSHFLKCEVKKILYSTNFHGWNRHNLGIHLASIFLKKQIEPITSHQKKTTVQQKLRHVNGGAPRWAKMRSSEPQRPANFHRFWWKWKLRPWKLRFDVGCLCVANVDNERGHQKLRECEHDLLELAKTMWLWRDI